MLEAEELLAGVGLVAAAYVALHCAAAFFVQLRNAVLQPGQAREQELADLRSRLDEFSALLHQAQQPALPAPTVIENTNAKL